MIRNLKRLINTELDGVGVIEIILILVVLIGLVIIFRDQLGEIISNIFDRINEAINSF